MADEKDTGFDLFADDHDIPMYVADVGHVEKAPTPVKRKKPEPFLDDPEIIELTKRTKDVVDEMPWKEIVRKALAESGVAFSTNEAHGRCLAVGDTFLRGIRDESAAKARLLAPFDRGGAGLNLEDARKCMHMLMKASNEYMEQERRLHEQSKKTYVERSVEALKKDAGRHEAEDGHLDNRYRAMTKGVGVRASDNDRSTSPGNASAKPDLHPMIEPEHELMKRIEARLAVPAKPLRVKRQGPTTTVVKTTAVPSTANPPAATQPPPKPVAPLIPRDRSMVDIRRTTKLVGPVEELEVMTLDDFHRLARHPKEAVRRINEKIATLSAQGYVFKRRGIEAWKKSEVGVLYFSMLNDLLSGVPIDQSIAERKASGRPTLTKEEFTELMQLNDAMRFA